MKTEKIVVIEDEEDILEVIAYNLRREGYEVFTAGSGEESLDTIERVGPDLVLRKRSNYMKAISGLARGIAEGV